MNASGSALKFIISTITSLDKQNFSDIVIYLDQFKVLMDELVNKVKPDFLRERIREERLLWSSTKKPRFHSSKTTCPGWWFKFSATKVLAPMGSKRILGKSPLDPLLNIRRIRNVLIWVTHQTRTKQQDRRASRALNGLNLI